MPVQGTPKFDSIVAGQVTIDFLQNTPVMRVKAAYVDSKTGSRHGSTTQEVWSPQTMARLQDLRDALELDIARTRFDSISGAAEAPSEGLGEFLADGGAKPL